MQRRPGQLLVAIGLLAILVTTLSPLPSETEAAAATPLWCLVCGQYGGVDVINNILLFVPLGLGLRILSLPVPAVVAGGAALSLTIELVQLGLIPGRDASLSDVLTNTAGTWIGAVLGSTWRTLLWPSKSQGLRLAAVGAILWLGAQTGTAVLLRPWTPEGPLRSEWTPRVPARPRFTGRVAAATVFGIRAPEGAFRFSRDALALLARGEISLELSLRAGAALPRPAPVFRLVTSDGAFLQVESLGTSLVFQPPALSQRLRLRPPRLLVPTALPPEGGTGSLVAGERHDTVWASIGGSPHAKHYHVLSPSQTWSLIVPFSYSYGPEARLITGVWIVLLLVPIAYWSSRAFAGQVAWPAMGLLLLAGLGFIPYVLAYPRVHWSEWVAGGMAVGLGQAANRAGLYLEARCDSPSIKESC